MGLFEKKQEESNELEEFKNEILNRINALNNMVLEIKNQIELNTDEHKVKITNIEKALNILDEDIFEISGKVNKKTDNISKIAKTFSDLKTFAKLSLKNKEDIALQKAEILQLKKKISELNKKEIMIPVGTDEKKEFRKLQNQLNELKKGTIIVEKTKEKKKK